MASIPTTILKLLFRAGMKRDIRDPDKLARHLQGDERAFGPLSPRGVRLKRGKVAGKLATG